MKENCIFHYEHCGEYRKILDSRGFSPADMNGYEGLCRLPFLPTLLFKKHELYSLPSRRMLIQATSSGTSGMASRIGFETSGLLVWAADGAENNPAPKAAIAETCPLYDPGLSALQGK